MVTLANLEWPRRTARLELRPALASDAPAVWSWQRRPEVSEWLPSRPADEARFATGFAERAFETVVALLDGRIVATAKVAVQDAWSQAEIAERARGQQVELGWVVDPSVHGQGVGTELARELLAIAFEGLGVRRVVALCFADNVGSWKIMEKIGMRHEGLYRAESLHRDGRWLDGMTWAILADEWRARPATG